jgi:hypothetical protein
MLGWAVGMGACAMAVRLLALLLDRTPVGCTAANATAWLVSAQHELVVHPPVGAVSAVWSAVRMCLVSLRSEKCPDIFPCGVSVQTA